MLMANPYSYIQLWGKPLRLYCSDLAGPSLPPLASYLPGAWLAVICSDFYFFLPLICLHHTGNSLFKTEINIPLQWGMGSKHKHFQERCVFCALKIPLILDRKGVLSFSLRIVFFCDCLPICPLNPLCLCVALLMHSRTCFYLNIS